MGFLQNRGALTLIRTILQQFILLFSWVRLSQSGNPKLLSSHRLHLLCLLLLYSYRSVYCFLGSNVIHYQNVLLSPNSVLVVFKAGFVFSAQAVLEPTVGYLALSARITGMSHCVCFQGAFEEKPACLLKWRPYDFMSLTGFVFLSNYLGKYCSAFSFIKC